MNMQFIFGLLLFPMLVSGQESIKVPKGFVKVPAGKDAVREPGFYVMSEPVTKMEFHAFIDWLSPINRVDANRCLGAVPKDIPNPTNYIILADAFPAHRFADYLCEKHNIMKQRFTCRMVSTQDWKRMKGPTDIQLGDETNRYGIRFFSGIYEWKINRSGQAETYTDLNGYQRSGFRIILQPVPESSQKSPAKK